MWHTQAVAQWQFLMAVSFIRLFIWQTVSDDWCTVVVRCSGICGTPKINPRSKIRSTIPQTCLSGSYGQRQSFGLLWTSSSAAGKAGNTRTTHGDSEAASFFLVFLWLRRGPVRVIALLFINHAADCRHVFAPDLLFHRAILFNLLQDKLILFVANLTVL